ncbi:piggyBac transposable element-derived protein 4-like isoform X1 [Periplaneta americana]|uniref:piggyBac transposable element-derived protein 4-like isoform X1 n=1 Tax=Periplaneta americana TaxID=6978 RepID=UPI0037E9AE27
MAGKAGLSKQRGLSAADPDFETSLHVNVAEKAGPSRQRGFETNVRELLHENFHDSDDDDDPDFEIVSGHDSESEQEADQNDDSHEEESTEDGPREEYFYGKNKCFKWAKEPPPSSVRTRRHNVIIQLPGLRPTAEILGENPDPVDVLGLLFTQDMLEEIILWTNVKIGKLRTFYANKNLSCLHDVDLVELKAWIGLMVYTAIFKSGNESIHSFFATDGTGRDVFRCTLSMKRFLFLLTALQFDNPDDREERKKEERTAAISKIFELFIENSQICYSPGASVCVDEILVPFRGKCMFRMYMPKKPAKYGLKVQCLTDARTNYLYSAYIYSGKGSDGKTLSDQEKSLSIPSQAILRLVKPIENTGRNVTGDNWYTSVEAVNELSERGLTYVGTMKKNKKEIPRCFLPNKSRDEKSSIYGFTEDMTLVSFVPKKSKAIIILSSMHHTSDIDPDTGKPEIIMYYNMTKSGVDGLDQKCANYTSSRRTRRWPMAIFFTLVDVACGVNSYVLHQAYPKSEVLTRLDFMKTLARSLISPHMQRRLYAEHLPRELSFSIKRILKIEDEPQVQQEDFFEKRKTCAFCPPRLKRKTKYPCSRCGVPICLECSRKICVRCIHKD